VVQIARVNADNRDIGIEQLKRYGAM